jgi:hypothetical protein
VPRQARPTTGGGAPCGLGQDLPPGSEGGARGGPTGLGDGGAEHRHRLWRTPRLAMLPIGASRAPVARGRIRRWVVVSTTGRREEVEFTGVLSGPEEHKAAGMAAAAGAAGAGLATDPAHTRWIRRPNAAVASRAHHRRAWPSLAFPHWRGGCTALTGKGMGTRQHRDRGDAAVGG